MEPGGDKDILNLGGRINISLEKKIDTPHRYIEPGGVVSIYHLKKNIDIPYQYLEPGGVGVYHLKQEKKKRSYSDCCSTCQWLAATYYR